MRRRDAEAVFYGYFYSEKSALQDTKRCYIIKIEKDTKRCLIKRE